MQYELAICVTLLYNEDMETATGGTRMTTSYDKGGRSYGTAGSVTRTAYFKAEAIGGPGYGLTLSTTVTLTSPAAANEYAEGYFDGMDTAEASETQVRVHANQVTISTTGGTE